jgi:ferredoxin-NADP reductase
LHLQALSPGWRESFQAVLSTQEGVAGNAGLNEAATEPPAAWSGFRSTRVVEVVHETGTVVSLRLAASDDQVLPAAQPGQFVAVRLGLGDGHPPTSRSYSLSGSPASSGYRISVKREPHGTFSTFVHTNICTGAVLELSAPRGRFTLNTGEAPVLLVSAGIGATPVLSMLHALVQTGSRREVWWLHGARNSAEHVFAAEARGLLARLQNARTQICYSAPLMTDTLGQDYTYKGHLAADSIQGLLVPPHAHAYICGPQPFMTDLQAALVRLGVESAHIHTEVFGAGPRHHARNRGRTRETTPPTHRQPGPRSKRQLRPQRSDCAVARGLHQRPGAGRGLRHPDALVLPDRDLPHLRSWAARRNSVLRPSTRGPPG